MKKYGKSTILFDNPPAISGFASVVGKKESEGPLCPYFDVTCDDTTFGEKTWEKAESRMQKDAINKALDKAQLSPSDMDFIFAGDLLNQCIGSTYGIRDLEIPFIGLFGACSTMAESLCTGSVFVESGAANNCVCVTSSHFCSAERQFRFPLEYGGVRTPTAQWTVTGSGCMILSKTGPGPFVNAISVGRIQDLGIKDANNMGAAMAPAAAHTIAQFFKDTGTNPACYDLILTGDLGEVGSSLLIDLLKNEGFDISEYHNDCGLLIYNKDQTDINAGGSGCGCSASVLCSYIMHRMSTRELNNILFIATGALMSTTAVQQGESIPGIAHLVQIKNDVNGKF